MLGPKQEAQTALFYKLSLENHVQQDHLLRSIDRFVDLSDIRQYLAEIYSHTGRPSIDPDFLIRMLLVGYCLGIRRSGGCAKMFILTSLTGGSAVLICLIPCPTIQRFARSDMDGYPKVIRCAIYLKRPWCDASRIVLLAASALLQM